MEEQELAEFENCVAIIETVKALAIGLDGSVDLNTDVEKGLA